LDCILCIGAADAGSRPEDVGRKGQHEVNVKEALQMTAVSLAVIFGVLVLSMLLSVVVTKRKH